MTSIPPSPWIHIGECPVCVNGLVRIRACQSKAGEKHLFAMCDECQATWLEPDTNSKRIFPDAENALCPICSQSLFGPQSHWAWPDDINHSHDWSLAAIFDMPTSELETSEEPLAQRSSLSDVNALPNSDDEDLLSVEDIAIDGDAPALPAAAATQLHLEPPKLSSPLGDSSYGQDEPKPGC
jgi:hypothetical protein